MRKQTFNCFSSLLLLILFCPSFGYGREKDDCKDKFCLRPKTLCFNVYCIFHRKADHAKGFEKCRASSTFRRQVLGNGQELLEGGDRPIDTSFEVECDQAVVFNNGAFLTTVGTGSRIQGLPGPYPAITLPPRALREGHYYNFSFLQLEDQNLPGQCFVYTTPFEQK